MVKIVLKRVSVLVLVVLAVVSGLSMAVGEDPGVPSNGSVVIDLTLGVYSNEACTRVLEEVAWGSLEPGSSKTVVVYLKNEGNVAMFLRMRTSGWDPVEAEQYITLSWNLEGVTVQPDKVGVAELTLHVAPMIRDIEAFSFSIEFSASG